MYPDVNNYEETKQVFDKTIKYYISHDTQERLTI